MDALAGWLALLDLTCGLVDDGNRPSSASCSILAEGELDADTAKATRGGKRHRRFICPDGDLDAGFCSWPKAEDDRRFRGPARRL
jgi:hypothetical protein